VCENCTNGICSSTDFCDVCDPGFFGQDCNTTCTCINGNCYDGITGNGSCNGCYSGFMGIDCDQRCLDSLCSVSCPCNSTCVSQENTCVEPITLSNLTNITLTNNLPEIQVSNSNITLGSLKSLGTAIISSSEIHFEQNTSINIEGNFSLSSSTISMDIDSNIVVTDCFIMKNTSINVDLSKLNMSAINKIQPVEAKCIDIDNLSKFNFQNVPHLLALMNQRISQELSFCLLFAVILL